MSRKLRDHIRSNVVGYVAVFIALSGTAYAVDGPLPGVDQVGSEDIINGEVKARARDQRNRRRHPQPDHWLDEDRYRGDQGERAGRRLRVQRRGRAWSAERLRYRGRVAAGCRDRRRVARRRRSGNRFSRNFRGGAQRAHGRRRERVHARGPRRQDAFDPSCDPSTGAYIDCASLRFTAGRSMQVLTTFTYRVQDRQRRSVRRVRDDPRRRSDLEHGDDGQHRLGDLPVGFHTRG